MMKPTFSFVVCVALFSNVYAGELPTSGSDIFASAASRNSRIRQSPMTDAKKPNLPADFNPNVRNAFVKDRSGVPVHSVKPFTKAAVVKEVMKTEMDGDMGWPTNSPTNAPDGNPGEFISTPGQTEGHYEQTGKGPNGWANGDMDKPAVYFSVTPYLHLNYDGTEYYSTVEWHCITHEPWTNFHSVHGTYNQQFGMGYFEGTIVDNAAYVTYYENTMTWAPMGHGRFVPTTGSGMLVYDTDNWLYQSGYVWPSGQTSTWPYSYIDSWTYNMSPCYDCMPDDTESWEVHDWVKFTRKNCLWSPYDGFHTTMDQNLNNEIYGPKGNENTWTSDGVGPFHTNGSTIGAYTYTYSDEECDAFEEEGLFSCEEDGKVETGHYGLDAVSAIIGSNRIFVSSWNATSGPLKGQTGPQIGLFQTNAEWGREVGLKQSSFSSIFCYAKQGTWGSVYATGCTSQVSRHKGRDKKEAEKLLSAYDTFKGTKQSGLGRLRWLVDMIWG